MTSISLHWLRRPALAGVTLALAAVIVAACNGPTASGGMNALPADRRLPRTKPSPTPYQFNFSTLNDPGSTTFNRVMGVDQLGQIVGYYGRGTASDPSDGYSSLVPYTKFQSVDYPSAIDTVPTSLSDTRILAGYFVDSTKGHHTWGFMKNRGIWSQYKDYRTPKGPNSVNELLGVNDSGIAVGFYIDSYGNDKPYELATNGYHAISPPGAKSAMATGINQLGDISGTETLASSSGTVGWILRSGTFTDFAYPDAKSTEALSINFQDQIVGYYVDSKGTHGFILTNPQSPNQRTWQSVDEPDAAPGTTVITAMNNHHQICGYYVDKYGNTNGFTATVK